MESTKSDSSVELEETDASTKRANGFLPQPLGREFVRLYYTVMSKAPETLYRFYGPDAALLYGDVTAIGLDEIRKVIEGRELRNCHTRIFNLDAQVTLGNGVVVQVLGELSNNHEPLRPFAQTFVLSPQGPKHFFVLNEIFRYEDELPAQHTNLEQDREGGDNGQPIAFSLSTPTMRDTAVLSVVCEASFEANYADAAAQTCTAQSYQQYTPQLIMQPSMNAVFPLMEPQTAMLQSTVYQPMSNELPSSYSWCPMPMQQQYTSSAMTETVPEFAEHQVEPGAEADEDVTLHVLKETPQATDTADKVTKHAIEAPGPTTLKVENVATTAPTIFTATATTTTTASTTSTQQPAMTYANVFKIAGTRIIQPTPSNVQPETVNASADFEATFTSYIPSVVFAPTHALPKSSSSSTSKRDSSAPNVKSSGEDNKSNTAPREDPTSTSSTGTTQPQTQSQLQPQRPYQRRERYDDRLQLFLGNLPRSASVEALRKLFEIYGRIVDLRVLSKTSRPGMRKPPNYGFLTFDTVEAVQRCLADTPFYFSTDSHYNFRLNVRPKNETGEPEPVRARRADTNDQVGDAGTPSANENHAEERTGDTRVGHANTTETHPTNPAIGDANTHNTFSIEEWPQLCGASKPTERKRKQQSKNQI